MYGKRVFLPARAGGEWRTLLVQEGHWKKGHSAMTAAAAWTEAGDALPPEIAGALEVSGVPELEGLELLLAIPEWETPLPGGAAGSRTDILALTRNDRGLTVLAVEAKMKEGFGRTLGEARADATEGMQQRQRYLQQVLGLAKPLDDSIRYQLLHRTASAVITAEAFHAGTAVLVVQSFCHDDTSKQHYAAFLEALQAQPTRSGSPVYVAPTANSGRLFLLWCEGDSRFCEVELSP